MKNNLELPKTPIKPTNKDPRKLLIYGPPKIGKTSIVAGIPNNLVIDLEDGSEYIEALKVKANNFAELIEIGKAIKEAGNPYSFITTDTVTRLEDWSEKSATSKYKQTAQGKNFSGRTVIELDYGLGYGLLRAEYMFWLNQIYKLSPISILIGHVKDRMVGKEGNEVAVKDLNLTGQLKAMTTSDVDAVGYMYIDKENPRARRLTFLTSDEIVCGNRCPHLEGQDFLISEKMEDNTVKTYWEQIFTQLKQQ